jgi:hypothetical protein
VLLLLTGSSCSGKSTAARACGQLEQLAIHDSDEHGVPSDADTAWRQHDLERWVQQAIDYERDQVDLLLTGQSPLGELLATPSAPRLQAAAVCLLDVRDRERWWRLKGRDPGAWSRDEMRSFTSWAHWHRGCRLPRSWDRFEPSFATVMGPPRLPVMGPRRVARGGRGRLSAICPGLSIWRSQVAFREVRVNEVREVLRPSSLGIPRRPASRLILGPARLGARASIGRVDPAR